MIILMPNYRCSYSRFEDELTDAPTVPGEDSFVVLLNNRALRTTLHPGSMDLTDATPFLRAIRLAMVLSTHAERHRKIRALFNRIMSPRTIAQLRPATEQSAHRLIDRVAARGHMDVVKENGLAIPFEQISDLLCVTEDIRGTALRWTHAIFAGVSCMGRTIRKLLVLPMSRPSR